MLLADYDIVFQEVPDETTLALNISECPHHCHGCHSKYLRQAVGEVLTTEKLRALIDRYPYITCVSIQGGDKDIREVEQTARYVHEQGYKTCWYTGSEQLPEDFDLTTLDFVKIGPYVEAMGGLRSKTTNQRFYKVEHTEKGITLTDQTARFWR